MIKGDDLHVSRLTLEKGEVDIDGRIDSFTYSDAAGSGHKGESLLSKLFRYSLWQMKTNFYFMPC